MGCLGDRYALGCFNFLSVEGVVEAAQLVQSGQGLPAGRKGRACQTATVWAATVPHRIIPLAAPEE
jgi:hypothetical protein